MKRRYVKFHGHIDEAVIVSGGRSVTFLADPGAELTRSTGIGAIVTVQDDRTSLSIYDLSISNAPNGSIGCVTPPSAGSPSLSLTRVRIRNNPGGGVSISSGTFSIIGNMFFSNGGNSTTVGGLFINTSANAANRLEFNSFALNISQDGVAPAVQCVAGTFAAKNNIMSGNRTATATDINQFSGTCAHAYSIAQPGAIPPGTQNSGAPPLFAGPAGGDLHLQPSSPARRAADPSSDLTGDASRDIDGTLRVAPADIGAYQFR